jgi:ABC-type transport system substrate-binding protein
VKRNKKYWRKDAKGRQLPYLDGIVFKTIPDDSTRNAALASGEIDMLLTTNAGSIKTLKKMKGISWIVTTSTIRVTRTVNFIMMNNSGTENQFGDVGSLALPYIEKGRPYPRVVQDVIAGLAPGILGAVNPSTLQWDTTLTPVSTANDSPGLRHGDQPRDLPQGHCPGRRQRVRRHLSQVLAVLHQPQLPGLQPLGRDGAGQHVQEQKNNVSTVSFVIDIVSGNAEQTEQFAFIQQQLAAAGITVTPRAIEQAALIQNVEQGTFDASFFNEFGGIDQGLNYVWWDSVPAAPAYPNGSGPHVAARNDVHSRSGQLRPPGRPDH